MLRSMPNSAKQGSTHDARKLYIEQLVAKKMADSGLLNDAGERWTEQMERYDKISSLEDLRKFEGRS